ncbi:hypothetical protein RHIZO_01726 [Rhizobiaceae bacterium]|nr:hypothetical protein RHIZO_01726 [Rhizobiaceae bacterium]
MTQDEPPPREAAPPGGMAAYFRSRWNGQLPLATLFWRDMVIVGTTVNIAATLTAVLLLALDAPAPLAVAIHFAPVPWNVFLFTSVWRATARLRPTAAFAWQSAAALWLVLAVIS